MTISIKTTEELAIMRTAGKKLAQIMAEIGKRVAPGIDTLTLDKLAQELVFAHGGVPAFKGYGEPHNPFPATLCTSINNEVVHGIPSNIVVLKKGDLLKVDIGMQYQGFFVDMARTFAVGEIDNKAKRLIEVTEQSFHKSVKKLKSGVMMSQYCKSVQEIAESAGFSVVRNLVGHGIGRQLHEEPQIPNYYEKGFRDFKLEVGMTFALEPMINAGTSQTRLGDDDWVFVTADGKRSAHYENTIAITEKGVEILTAY